MFQYKLQLFLQNARKQKIKPLFNRPISLLLLTSKAMEKSRSDAGLSSKNWTALDLPIRL